MANIRVKSHNIEIHSNYCIIVGSGAAGLNCALHLVDEGVPAEKIAILTEKLGGGTSFNTGSDKQTYYKLSIIGNQDDSPYQMAKDFLRGGAMHGDIALIESTNSVREFFHLVELGVPFPQDEFGGYVGYKTDNDPKQRATSIGPLTSQKMCECLLKSIRDTDINIIDNHYVIHLITDDNQAPRKAIGLIALDIVNLKQERDIKNFIESLKIYLADNIILATGGPAALYKNSVYPPSQCGSLGLAINAGCKLQNLTESQFGLASTHFRWNLSGSYQQVIPRYISRDMKGKETKFLDQYFSSFELLSRAIFLKGYQWPFNSERIEKFGSSLIDLAVYYESEILGKDVFLDFRNNPNEYNESKLHPIAYEYLKNSEALADSPIKRLEKLNPDAIHLYKNHDIDLWKEPLQIAVCNQHLNGGISGDMWWETNIQNLFAIGEVNGSHGIHRPGGAALNSGQVGGLRAAQKIAHKSRNMLRPKLTQTPEIIKPIITSYINQVSSLLDNKDESLYTPNKLLDQIRNRMSRYGSIIRPLKSLSNKLKSLKQNLQNLHYRCIINNNTEILKYFKVKDALLTQYFILSSILNYHKMYGRSRDSYLVIRDKLKGSFNERYIEPPGALNQLRFISSESDLSNKIQTIQEIDGKVIIEWEDVRPIPTDFGWFEKTWKRFKNGDIFK
ncbi:MAG: Succinate dehydrogenase flavoprotein subunit [Promethearchaeota archaeon]|nr:MAG: Succinate dehydrogenase flavoprotein subunit [Candidatus Lokiarchaeota archaeon]